MGELTKAERRTLERARWVADRVARMVNDRDELLTVLLAAAIIVARARDDDGAAALTSGIASLQDAVERMKR